MEQIPLKHLTRTGILTPGQKQAPFVEFSTSGYWRVWLSFAMRDGHLVGTYLELLPDGAINRITTDNNSTPTKGVVVSGPSKEHSNGRSSINDRVIEPYNLYDARKHG